jgi:hypothetical protein
MTMFALCPRCGFRCADVWRLELAGRQRTEHLICRACAFDWGMTTRVDSLDRSTLLLNYFIREES